MGTIKVILPVEDIPLGSTVTKATGAVEFILKDSLTVAGQKLVAMEGTRFIVPKDVHKHTNSISAVATSQEMAWLADDEELFGWLGSRLDPEENK